MTDSNSVDNSTTAQTSAATMTTATVATDDNRQQQIQTGEPPQQQPNNQVVQQQQQPPPEGQVVNNAVNGQQQQQAADVCPVCHDAIQNPARPDGCRHMHCLRCLHQWSTGHNRCSVCRQPYENIRYHIVDDEHFEQLPIRYREQPVEQMFEPIRIPMMAPEARRPGERHRSRYMNRRRAARANRYERQGDRFERQAERFVRRARNLRRLAQVAEKQAEVRQRRARRRRLFAQRVRNREV
ncbi:uncharacterized protein LOC128953971 [Oppia nitens]|uniref:uncharacterized protein LOC128953971 n=1 Tax=Oppia nitens TaxID=1686743 RepID=UPI0023D9E0C0|nr:uncharacterized protein LOC128953971 [Oppia nitens]